MKKPSQFTTFRRVHHCRIGGKAIGLCLSAGFLLPALICSAQTISPPVMCGFEAPDFRPGSIDGQRGWSVQQGKAEIVTGEARSGAAALKLFPADPFSQAKLSLQPGVPPSAVMFVDFYVIPVASELAKSEEFLDVDGARIGLFHGENQKGTATLHFFNGDGDGKGEWVSTGVELPVPEDGKTKTWVRLTLREDFARQTWDLWVNGKPAAGDAGFHEANAGHTQNYIIMGDAAASVYLDDLSIAAANPLGQDSDLDGLPDALEARLSMNHLFDDRDGDADGDGTPNLEEAFRAAAGEAPVRLVESGSSLSAPVFSAASGIADKAFSLEIKGGGDGGKVLFTSDGSDPRRYPSNAREWSGAVRIERTTVLRAVTVDRKGRMSATATAAWVFPGLTAPQGRPAGVEEVFADRGFSGAEAAAHRIPWEVSPVDGLEQSLRSAPVVVISAGLGDFFSNNGGIYAQSSRRGVAPASVVCLDGAGGFEQSSVVSISGESSRYHDITPKHSLRLRFEKAGTIAERLTGAKPGRQMLLRHPTHDSWTVGSHWAGNRNNAKYFADALASNWMAAAGHPSLKRRWVHVFLNDAYWGVYEAIEQYEAGAEVSALLESGSGQTEAVFGDIREWRNLRRELGDLSSQAMNGTVDGGKWAAVAAGLDTGSLIDYMLLNMWLTNLDWPDHNYLVARAGEKWRFLSWDAEWSLRKDDGRDVDMTARIHGTSDGPAYVFTALCWWPEFRAQVAERLKGLTAENGLLHPGVLGRRLEMEATEFATVMPGELGRWGGGFPGALEKWEGHLEWLRAEYVPVRTSLVASHVAAILEHYAKRSTEASIAARERGSSAVAVTAPFRPAKMVVDTAGDRDGDGMPDDWEKLQGLDPRSAEDGLRDSDGDGLSNLEEFLLGRQAGFAEPLTGVFAVEPAGVQTRASIPKVRNGRRVNLLSRPLNPAELTEAAAAEAREAAGNK